MPDLVNIVLFISLTDFNKFIEEKYLDLIFRNKLDLVLKDKKLQDELSLNISKTALPNASNDIVELIKKHLNNAK